MVLLFLKFFLKYVSVQYNVHLEYVQGGFLAYTTLVIDLEHVLLMKYLHPYDRKFTPCFMQNCKQCQVSCL